MIRKIKGKGDTSRVQHLLDGDHLLTSPADITNKLAETFEHVSSSDNCHPAFVPIKMREERNQLKFQSNNSEDYNQFLTMEELKKSLKKITQHRSWS